jgi:Tol biopolymer transport system component
VSESGEKDRDYFSGEPLRGELLSLRLGQGALPPEEALRYAIEVGSALAQAHSRGRVHTALSPFTILLTDKGARILQPPSTPDPRGAPYRSPEQVRGLEADWRSDIFSYGAVLYEMASGRRAFPGEGPDLLSAILLKPPATLLGCSPVHAAMEGVIAGCLLKDPTQRRQRIQNAVIELKLAGRSLARAAWRRSRESEQSALKAVAPAAPGKTATPRPEDPLDGRPPSAVVEPPSAFRRRFAMIGLLVLALAAIAGAGVVYLGRQTTPSVLRFAINAPEHTTYPGTPSISPDGRYLAFSATGAEGRRMLWLRPLDEVHASVIPGTEDGFAPFWSPDSQSIAFFANRSLKRIRVRTEASSPNTPKTICAVEDIPGGGAWNSDGSILFAPSVNGGLYKVPAEGGQPQPYFKLNPSGSERAQLWPQFLPDGKHFIFFGLTEITETTGVYAGSLDRPDHQFLFASDTNAVFSPKTAGDSRNGYLLYVRDRDLVARPFEASQTAVRGEPITLTPDIGAVLSLSLAPVSVSSNSILAYQSVGRPTRQLVWMDRDGKPLGSPSGPGEWGPPRISPDGTRAVVAKLGADGQNADLWILAAAGGVIQLTDTPTHEGSPIWSPDGTRVVYFSNQDGGYDIYMKTATATANPLLLYKSPFPKYPTDWSRDSKFILFGSLADTTKADVWAFSTADRRATPILDTVSSEGYGAISADGKWLAFQSDESGLNQVYVQAFDPNSSGTKRRWQVSPNGGGLPRWRADGGELFYMTSGGRMMSVALHPSGTEFAFDEPRLLFETRPIPKSWNLYDVSRDGQRFLVNLPLEWSSSSPITVVTNWTQKLKL